ncbi:MAG: hypothetical protein HY868_25480 [Chloroflexi bacterium]|nr:hypothetical protein [Chloroflexota bacterium]
MSKINPNAPYIPELDDYELPAEFKFDRRKMKRNPYAGHVKLTHGGARPGAGRKPLAEPVERHTITLFKSHAKFLRGLDSNLSAAIRKLIAKAK